MKVRDKRLDALRGAKPTGVEKVEGRKADEGGKAQQVQGTQKAPLIENEAGGKAAKAALRALALDSDSDSAQTRTRGADLGLTGAKLMAAPPKKKGKSGMQKAAAVAALGISLLGMVQTASADVVYLDFNNGVKEIETARKMAQAQGEDFHLVRPTPEALEAIFAKAEAGEADLSTLILSGHSLGDGIWGSGPDGTSHDAEIEDFEKLKEKYPKAFGQVKHVFFMACYAGGKAHSANWNKVFHNARAVVGFYGSGPASHRPASSWVMQNVENALDNLPDATLSPQQALLKAKQISRLKGPAQTKFGIRLDGVHHQHGAKSTSAEAALEQVGFARNQSFTPYFDATPGHESPPTNHQSSPLRDYYNQVQDALNSVEPGSAQASALNKDIKTTIRLIYFDNIQKNVEKEHRGDFDAANAELSQFGSDVQIPKDIKQMSRADVVKLSAQLAAVDDPGERIVVAKEGGAVEATANDWLKSIGSELRLSFDGVESARDVRTRMGEVKDLIEARTFDADDLKEIGDLQTRIDAFKGMSEGEKTAHIEGKLNSALEDKLHQVKTTLEDEQSALEMPAAGSLTRDSARELATKLTAEVEAIDSYTTWSLEKLASELTEWAGEPNESANQLLTKNLMQESRYAFGNVNKSLKALGNAGLPGLTEGDATPTLEAVSKALTAAMKIATAAESAPVNVLGAFDGLETAMSAAKATAVERVQGVFSRGLVELDSEAIPDNWITD